MATDDVEEHVRARVRQLRFERGMSLRALSVTTGISAATLSRLETGRRRITVTHLALLAVAFGVDAGTLLGAVPADERPRARDGRLWDPIGPQRTRGRRVYRIEIPPGGTPHLHSHEGHQWLYVLDGRVRLVVEDDDRVLRCGDAAEFDTWRPHWLGAVGRTAQALVIFSPEGTPLPGGTLVQTRVFHQDGGGA